MFFRKSTKEQPKATRLFFATDLHGSLDCFLKFLNAGKAYQCDCLVMGGDITGKMVVPIIEQADGTFEATFQGNHYKLADRRAVAELEEHISRSGSYAYATDADSMLRLQELGERDRKIEEISVELMRERLREWMRLAEERLGSSDVSVFMEAGNDDPFELDAILNSSDVVVVHDGKVVRIDEHHEMIGLGYANITPWKCPRDIEEDELRVRIDDLVARLEDVPNSVFCMHVPPKDSTLDTCLKLDASVYPPAVVVDRRGPRRSMERAALRLLRQSRRISRWQVCTDTYTKLVAE